MLSQGTLTVYVHVPPLFRSSILPGPSKQAQRRLQGARASGRLEAIVYEALGQHLASADARVQTRVRMRPVGLLDGGELWAPANTKIQDLGIRFSQKLAEQGTAWVVESVARDSWADVFGLREADQILWINGRPMSGMSLREVLQSSHDEPLKLTLSSIWVH